MDEQKAKEILADSINEDGSLERYHDYYIKWELGDESVLIDGNLSIEELEAIAWWMKNKG
jgi:hypothetical protein